MAARDPIFTGADERVHFGDLAVACRRLVEPQSGLRAVPRDELVDGVPELSGVLRGQAVEDC